MATTLLRAPHGHLFTLFTFVIWRLEIESNSAIVKRPQPAWWADAVILSSLFAIAALGQKVVTVLVVN
jgi:hypothetical protein